MPGMRVSFSDFLPLHSWLSTLGPPTDSSKQCAGCARSLLSEAKLELDSGVGRVKRDVILLFAYPTNTKEVR